MFKYKKSDYETKFQEVDPTKIINELDIEIKAKKEAELNLPLEDSTDLDVNEFSIKKYMLDKIKEANELVINKKTVYNNILFRITEATNKFKEMKNLPDKYKNECEYYISQAKEEYLDKKNKFIAMEKDLKNFKLENKLEREEVSTNYPLIFISLLIFVIIFESVINATFFAKANDLGLLGGFTQAVIISLINVAAAFFVIILYRYRNNIKLSKIKKDLYSIGISVLILGILFFHLLIGHFRDALSIDPENAYKISINNFMNTPFELMTFESWLLISIGIILFLFFIIDLKSFKDSYPGYTEITKRYEKEKYQLDNLKLKILDDIKNEEELIEKELKSLIYHIKSVFNESRDIPNFKKDLEAKYNEHIMHLENTYGLLIRRYRSINLTSRTGPKPKYFDNVARLNDYERIDLEIELDNEKIHNLETIVENIPDTEAKLFKEFITITNQIKSNAEFING